jgi:NTE family protein
LVFDAFRRSRNGDRGMEAAPDATPPVTERPVIGLALGRGLARGFAHIGVIRTLLANGITPNVIVGTSIGAVVGGCYAQNQLDSLEEWSHTLTWRGILGYLDISLSGAGLIGGGRLAKRLEETLGEALIEQ